MLSGSVRQLVIPLLASLFAVPSAFFWWAAIFLVPAFLSAVARYATFHYVLHDDEMVVRYGLLTRTERNIPLGRIQNLDLVENLLHRFFGVAEVRIETASGGKPEAIIRVLTRAQIDELRAHLDAQDHQPQEAVSGEAAKPLVEQSLGDLVALGLLSNRGMLVVAAGAGVLQRFGVFDDPEKIKGFEKWLPAMVEEASSAAWSTGAWILAVVLGVALFALATRLLSVVFVVATLYGFRLDRHRDDLSAAYGLLTRVTATLPRRRLQLLSIHRPWLGRPWRVASMKVETAGGGASKERQGPGSARLWMAPLVDEERALDLVLEALPAIDPRSVCWQPLSNAAPRRLARRDAVLTLLVVLFVGLLLGPPLVPLVLLAAPLAALAGWRGWRFAKRSAWGFAVEPEEVASRDAKRAIFFRSGAFDQHESLVPLGKIQAVAVKQTPFDRRWQMATLRVDTAGASAGGHRVEIPLLDLDIARQLADQLAAHAAETAFLW